MEKTGCAGASVGAGAGAGTGLLTLALLLTTLLLGAFLDARGLLAVPLFLAFPEERFAFFLGMPRQVGSGSTYP